MVIEAMAALDCLLVSKSHKTAWPYENVHRDYVRGWSRRYLVWNKHIFRFEVTVHKQAGVKSVHSVREVRYKNSGFSGALLSIDRRSGDFERCAVGWQPLAKTAALEIRKLKITA
jgi:hypothetical protein